MGTVGCCVGATVGVIPEGALPVDAGGSTQPVRIAKSSIAVAKIQKVFFMIISPFTGIRRIPIGLPGGVHLLTKIIYRRHGEIKRLV